MGDKEKIYSILDSLIENNNIDSLLQQGFQFSQINELIIKCCDLKYLENNGGKLKITESGQKFINEQRQKDINLNIKKTNDAKRIKKISKEFIYIPNKDYIDY